MNIKEDMELLSLVSSIDGDDYDDVKGVVDQYVYYKDTSYETERKRSTLIHDLKSLKKSKNPNVVKLVRLIKKGVYCPNRRAFIRRVLQKTAAVLAIIVLSISLLISLHVLLSPALRASFFCALSGSSTACRSPLFPQPDLYGLYMPSLVPNGYQIAGIRGNPTTRRLTVRYCNAEGQALIYRYDRKGESLQDRGKYTHCSFTIQNGRFQIISYGAAVTRIEGHLQNGSSYSIEGPVSDDLLEQIAASIEQQ